MATVKRVIEVCNRCIPSKAKEVTVKRTFALDGSWYELPLCDEHAATFDRDLGRWTMIADEIDAPNGRTKSEYFTAERRREALRIAELRTKAANKIASENFAERRRAELDAEAEDRAEHEARQTIPGALNWNLTDHARERMAERGFSIFDTLQAAAQPKQTFRQPWRGPFVAVNQHGDCRVIVNEAEKLIITVMDRSFATPTTPPTPTHQETQVAR